MKRAFGIDVSKWQGVIDYIVLAALNLVTFMFIRAGSIDNWSGQCYTDYQFERNSKQAPKWFKRIGYYWYFRPNHDPVKQAKYFAALIKNVYWSLPPAVDVETNGGMSASTASYRLKIFIETLQAELGHDHVIVYTRGTIWNPYFLRMSWWSQFTLWVARYAVLSGPWSDGKYRPLDWQNWGFWQMTEKLDGNKYGMDSWDLDGDDFNGTVEDLDDYIKKYGKWWGEDPQPEPEAWKWQVTNALRSEGYDITDPA